MPQSNLAAVLTLKSKGRSAVEISEELGLHVSTVYRIIQAQKASPEVSSEKTFSKKKSTSYTLTKEQHADLLKICYLLQLTEKEAMDKVVYAFSDQVVHAFKKYYDETV